MTNKTADFLVELGTEELPPKALSKLSKAFAAGITESLKKSKLNFAKVETFASPRRLAVKIDALDVKQEDILVERKGPALQAAFKEDGCPTPAALGFAKSCGIDVNDLEKSETDKGAWLVFKKSVEGKMTQALLPEMVENALAKLPIPKRMRWGNRKAQFVRPVHWLVMLLGDEVIDCEILELKSDRLTRGHRFHCTNPIEISNPSVYELLLETQGNVIANFKKRKSLIENQVKKAGESLNGTAIIDPNLLNEVTGLVEWPVTVIGDFDKQFLDIPPEALISAMKGHQKYFHVMQNESLLPHFITVSNIESKNPDTVKHGNERVIRPRLSDADFFWNTDKKTPLAAELEKLKTVVFQKQLGTVFEKTQRITNISETISTTLSVDKASVIRAAKLCKCDLMTEMVGEFPELQGIMGRYYALHDNENHEVAEALLEHYMPRFSGDNLPASTSGQIVSIADKLDTLVGIFSIGQIPTGDKDPFALRRATLGVLRIIIEKELPLDLLDLLKTVAANYENVDDSTINAVYQFMMDRLKAYYLEKNIRTPVFDAVLATKPTSPVDFNSRINAVALFEKSESAASLAAANKRINNILKKNKSTLNSKVDVDLFETEQEQILNTKLETLKQDVQTFAEKHQYAEALELLAELKEPIDDFFDNVMVMADDEKLRNNRLTLLSTMYQQFTKIADISKLS